MTDVLVVGGGIGGLVAAWEFARAGRAVTVLEAAPVLGGKLRPGGEVGFDRGAESFATRTTGVVDLIADVGLDLTVVAPEPAPAHLVDLDSSGALRRLPLPRRTILGLPADPAAFDVAAIVGADGVARALLEPSAPPTGTEPSLYELATQRFGAAVADRLVQPLCLSVHSRSARDVRLSAVHPALWRAFTRSGSLTAAVAALAPDATAGAAVRGIVGGVWRLANELSRVLADLGVTLRSGAAVDRVEGHRVVLGTDPLPAETVVLATGPEAARSLLGLPPARPIAVVENVTARLRAPELDTHPVGTGVIVAPDVPTRAKALTHVSAKWAWAAERLTPGEHLVRLSARDAAHPPTGAPQIAAEIAALTGVPVASAAIRELTSTHWPDALGGPDADVLAACRQHGIVAVGAAASGTGLAAVIPHARAAARAVLDHSAEPLSAPTLEVSA